MIVCPNMMHEMNGCAYVVKLWVSNVDREGCPAVEMYTTSLLTVTAIFWENYWYILHDGCPVGELRVHLP